MATDPDFINTRQQVFNLSGELFGSDAVAEPPARYIREFVDPTAAPHYVSPRRTVAGPREKEQRDLATQTVDTADQPLRRKPLVGYLSTVRAARTVHQHAVLFWDQNRMPRYLGASSRPDPSEEALDRQYEDLELFSYLPDRLMPTRGTYGDWAKPSRRPAVLTRLLPRMGIAVEDAEDDPTDIGEPVFDERTDRQLLTAVTPFTDSLTDFCRDKLREVLGG